LETSIFVNLINICLPARLARLCCPGTSSFCLRHVVETETHCPSF